MSALSPTQAEVYFDDIEHDLRRIAGKLHAVKWATLSQAAHNNERMAAIAYLAGFIAGRQDLADKLESIWTEVLSDHYYENKSWTTVQRMHSYLTDGWYDLGMPTVNTREDVQSAITWLVWHLYGRTQA